MAHADIIFVHLTGDHTRGIDWELQTLRVSNYLEKTILLTLDDSNKPMEISAIAPMLRSAGLNEVIRELGTDRRQQVIYQANDRWNSIFIQYPTMLKNPLASLKIAIAKLLEKHPVRRNWSSKQMSAPASDERQDRRGGSCALACFLALLCVGALALKFKADHDAKLELENSESTLILISK